MSVAVEANIRVGRAVLNPVLEIDDFSWLATSIAISQL
jgi:hypothetical protein